MDHQWKTLTIERYVHNNKMCFLKHGEYYYYAETECVRELAECEQQFGENVLFVEKILPITGEVFVGKMISQIEAYEKVLSNRGYHISKGPPYVVPSWSDYVDVSSKFWGVLSTIPIILQAKSYNRVSTLLSFSLIVLDLNRHWLYKIYDGVFNCFVKFVKRYIFKERANFYTIFSLFSSRWNFAFVIPAGQSIPIRPYCKLELMCDFEINDFEVYGGESTIENLCVEMDIDRGHVSLMQNNVLYTMATLNRPLYVPAVKLELGQEMKRQFMKAGITTGVQFLQSAREHDLQRERELEPERELLRVLARERDLRLRREREQQLRRKRKSQRKRQREILSEIELGRDIEPESELGLRHRQREIEIVCQK